MDFFVLLWIKGTFTKMGKNLVVKLVVMVVAVTVFCPFVASQQQQRSNGNIGSGKNGSGVLLTNSRDMSARMISTRGQGNQRQRVQDEEDDGDSAHDNSPELPKDEIIFPGDYEPISSTSTTERSTNGNRTNGRQNRWKKIPLDALVKFGMESNLSSFFKKYVKNTKVMRDNDTQEEYLTDAEGRPILDQRKGKDAAKFLKMGYYIRL